MGNLFNPDAPLMQGLNKAADLVLLNILTVLLSIPVVTAGAAVTALYDAMWRILRDEGSIYKNYFLAFKSNFKQATVLWLLTLVSGALLAYSMFFYLTNSYYVLLVISFVALILWATTTAWVFPLQSRFANSVTATVKNAFYCGLGYFPRSLLMMVLNLLPLATLVVLPGVWLHLGFLWAIIWFALAAYLNMRIIRKPFNKLAGIEDEAKEAEE